MEIEGWSGRKSPVFSAVAAHLLAGNQNVLALFARDLGCTWALAGHSEARALLGEAKADHPVGRKFDFLCQEFNREANTLCSKSADIELTRIGIDLKGAIERLREQVQNVE